VAGRAAGAEPAAFPRPGILLKALALPIDGGAACRTEMKGQRVAAFSCPHPRCRLTGEGDLIAANGLPTATCLGSRTAQQSAVQDGWLATVEEAAQRPHAPAGSRFQSSAQ